MGHSVLHNRPSPICSPSHSYSDQEEVFEAPRDHQVLSKLWAFVVMALCNTTGVSSRNQFWHCSGRFSLILHSIPFSIPYWALSNLPVTLLTLDALSDFFKDCLWDLQRWTILLYSYRNWLNSTWYSLLTIFINKI